MRLPSTSSKLFLSAAAARVGEVVLVLGGGDAFLVLPAARLQVSLHCCVLLGCVQLNRQQGRLICICKLLCTDDEIAPTVVL